MHILNREADFFVARTEVGKNRSMQMLCFSGGWQAEGMEAGDYPLRTIEEFAAAIVWEL